MPAEPQISRIIRSNRKSISLEITPEGKLIVRAPHKVSDAQIKAIVAQKAGWVIKHQIRLAKVQRQPKKFIPGETFWYLGKQYPLILTDRKTPPLELDGAFYLARRAQENAKSIFIEWYRTETRLITRQLVDRYISQYNFKVNNIRITSAKTRWGSCSSRGNLNFTYRLSMAPIPAIEYVVAHELAHLNVRNHGQDFWDEVARIYPNYKTPRTWLKQNGARLDFLMK